MNKILLVPLVTGVYITVQADNVQSKPNIVVIVVDDLGSEALGCYGSKVIKTPVIDNFAKESVLFTNAYCTSASSAASRAVILTGMYGHAINCYGHNGNAPERLKSLPVVLEQNGYKTAQCGKLHVNPEKVFHFQNYYKADSRNPYAMAEACRIFIEQSADQPFFLYFCPIDPHRSDGFDTVSEYKPNMFGNQKTGYLDISGKKYNPGDMDVPWFLPDTKACRAELAQYAESVSRLDEGMNRLFKILKESGKYDNTLILFISDNGIAFPGAKTNMYEPALKLPCILKLPSGKRAGSTSNSFLNWADITPTMLDFAGITPGKNLHGQSFKAVAENSDAVPNKLVFGSHIYHEPTMYYPMRSVRRENYKLIMNIAYYLPYPFATDLWTSAAWQFFLKDNVYRKKIARIDDADFKAPQQDKFPTDMLTLDIPYIAKSKAVWGARIVSDYIFRPEFELYNLKNDPQERKNLAKDKRYASVLYELKMELRKFQERTSDPWLIKAFYE